MKIALSVLKTYLPINASPEVIAEAFVHLGFEIEGMETLGYCGQGPLVVGRVLEKAKHPDSDHLSVCKVDVGQAEPLQIVCGASNFKAGDVVPVALDGARLGNVVLKKTRMRGVESCGMMCSASELGLDAGESAGLYILNDLNPDIGTPLEVLFGDRKDVVFDVSITSNRGDCLSYLGLVRELSAYFEIPVKRPDVKIVYPSVDETFVSIETDNCDYFSGCLLENITIKPSPESIQSFLQKSGLRAINNVVDATNMVLLEQGQPLHAFDAQTLGKHLCVRLAKEGEGLRTLDGMDRKLSADIMIVADENQALSIAGVMGGASSEIKQTTTRVFVECAHFNQACIRKTVQNLNITTDSSYRFERFVDKSNAPYALARMIQLLQLTCPDLCVSQHVCLGSASVPERTLRVSFGKIKRVLGFEVEADVFKQVLQRLSFSIKDKAPDEWEVSIPSYRQDVTQDVDLVEEFIRLWGTDKIPTKRPDGVVCEIKDSAENELRNRHASILSNAGFYECYTDTLQPFEWYNGFLNEKILLALTLDKPLSAEHACLRTSLIPGLVNALKDNRRHGNTVERLFETGRIFKVDAKGQLCEMFATAFVFCSSQARQWMKMAPFNFYEAQHYVRSLIMAGGMPGTSVQSACLAEIPLWQKGYSGCIGLWEQRGFEAILGYLDLNFTQTWFKSEVVFGAECIWVPERIRFKDMKLFQSYSECPTIAKDIALWVDRPLLGEEVRQSIIKSLKKLVKNPVQVRDVYLFDLFNDSQNLSKKSLAFSIVFGSNCGTPTEEMVSSIFEALQDSLEKTYGYQVRKQ